MSSPLTLNNKSKLNIVQNYKDLELGINVPENLLSAYTQNDPDRMIIDLLDIDPPEPVQPKKNFAGKEIYSGVKHKQYWFKGSGLVNVVFIDLNNPAIELLPVSSSKSTLFSKRSVNSMIYLNNAIAGINASFFKPPNGLPLGTLLINEEFYTGPIFNRVSLVIDKNNRAYLDQVKFDGICILPDNTVLTLQNINQPRTSVKGYMLYTDKWRSIVPKTLKNELQVAILNGRVVRTSTASLTVPVGGYVITGPNNQQFRFLKAGDSINVAYKVSSHINNIKHAIGGGPHLLKNGKVYVDSQAQKFSLGGGRKDPRTAVGITADNQLLMVTVDGRQKGSSGMSFYELARFMQSLGAVEAMNFDGGSSTQMSVKGKVVNRPTVRGGAPISTAIVVKACDDFSIAIKNP